MYPSGQWLINFFKKLQFIKTKLKEWNTKHFKNIFVEKARTEMESDQLNKKGFLHGM